MTTLNDYIRNLQKFVNNNPEAGEVLVTMTQSGYYSDGAEADLFDAPEIRRVDGYLRVVLGHSHQSY
jgi:hypothetical protein